MFLEKSITLATLDRSLPIFEKSRGKPIQIGFTFKGSLFTPMVLVKSTLNTWVWKDKLVLLDFVS